MSSKSSSTNVPSPADVAAEKTSLDDIINDFSEDDLKYINPDSEKFMNEEFVSKAYNSIFKISPYFASELFQSQSVLLKKGLLEMMKSPSAQKSIEEYYEYFVSRPIAANNQSPRNIFDGTMKQIYDVFWNNLQFVFLNTTTSVDFLDYAVLHFKGLSAKDKLYLKKFYKHPKCSEENRQFMKQFVMIFFGISFINYMIEPAVISDIQEIIKKNGLSWVIETTELAKNIRNGSFEVIERIKDLFTQLMAKDSILACFEKFKDAYQNPNIQKLIPMLTKLLPSEVAGFDLSAIFEFMNGLKTTVGGEGGEESSSESAASLQQTHTSAASSMEESFGKI